MHQFAFAPGEKGSSTTERQLGHTASFVWRIQKSSELVFAILAFFFVGNRGSLTDRLAVQMFKGGIFLPPIKIVPRH